MSLESVNKLGIQVQVAMQCPDTHLRVATVQALVGRGRAWIYAQVAAGVFPPPLLRGRWRAGDVFQWLNGQWRGKL